jgi:hypothetical protein
MSTNDIRTYQGYFLNQGMFPIQGTEDANTTRTMFLKKIIAAFLKHDDTVSDDIIDTIVEKYNRLLAVSIQ